MKFARRRFLQTAVAVGVAAMLPFRALAAAWNKAAFEAEVMSEGLKEIGATNLTESDQIELKAPEIAENGAIVPIEVTSRIPDTKIMYIFAEKNPQPLVASFEFKKSAEPFVATRIKMGESAKVHVVVAAGGKFYVASREVKVTIGGCGT